MELLADGRVRPVWTELPFADLGKAVEPVEWRSNLGRVLLRTA